jgi:hypothetical protein
MSQIKTTDLQSVTKFDGTYFHVWKHQMKLILKVEKLFQVVNGTLVKPNTPPATTGGQVVHTLTIGMGSKAEWDAKDVLAFTIITTNSL